MLRSPIILGALCLVGCSVNTDELHEALIERASFDLNCPKGKIHTKLLQGDEWDDEYIYGAEGCKNRQTYQVITELNTFKIYKEGAAPAKVIVKNHTYINNSASTPVSSPPLEVWKYKP